MNTISKKTLSILIAVILLSQQANADFWSALNVGQLKTSEGGFQKHVGANGENVYALGGSLTLKRQNPNYPLWWNFQPPSIQASCSGVSFKGMFGTIVNLDQITEQFEEAGSSLAWGVMVGIIYSLPGIGEVFQKLDEWAKKLQAMLANACNAGIALGKGIAKGPINDAVSSVDGFKVPEEWVKTGADVVSTANKLASIFDCSSNIYKNSATLSATCNELFLTGKNAVGSNYATSPSIITSTLLKNYRDRSYWPGVLTDGKFTEINWADLGTATNLETIREIAFAGIITSTVGEVYASEKFAKAYISLQTLIADTTETTGNERAISTAIEKLQACFEDNYENPIIKHGKNNPDEVAKFLIYGNKTNTINDSSDSNATSSSSTIAQNILESFVLPKVVVFTEIDNGAAKARISAFAVNSFTDSSGIHAEITNQILNYEGVIEIANNNAQCYLAGEDSNSTSCVNAGSSMVDAPLVAYYAKVYKNTRDTAIKAILKEHYSKLVQYHLAYAIYNKILEVSSNISDDIVYSTEKEAVTGTGPKSQEMSMTATNNVENKVSDKVNEFAKKVKESIDSMFKNEKISVDSITKIYKEQDKENLKRAYKLNG